MNQHKQAIADTLLDQGSVFIHLDPRVPGVVVPPWLKHQAHLVLQFGHGLAIPIPDLLTTGVDISGTLSFSRTPFKCIVPWNAVFAVVGDSGRGQVWNESMPPEIAALQQRGAALTVKPALRLVKGGAKRTTPAIGVLKRIK